MHRDQKMKDIVGMYRKVKEITRKKINSNRIYKMYKMERNDITKIEWIRQRDLPCQQRRELNNR